MKVTLIRNTGFFAMGSPLTVKANGQKSLLFQNQEQVLELPDTGTQRIQVGFSLLKSQPYELSNQHDVTLEVTMNPAFLWVYVLLFALLLVASRGIVPLVAGLVLYLLLMYRLCGRAYLIKEVA